MKTLLIAIKSILKFLAVTIGGLLAFFILYYAWNRVTAIPKERALDAICKTEVGSPIEDVIPRARKLGFDEKNGSHIDIIVYTEDERGNRHSVRPFQDDLNGLDKGRILFGKILLYPFGRGICGITFEKRKVTETRRSFVG